MNAALLALTLTHGNEPKETEMTAPASAKLAPDPRPREALLREFHDVLNGRIRMSALRFMELVRLINRSG